MTDQDVTPEEQAILAAIQRHAEDFDAIARRIEKLSDPVRAFRLASQLGERQGGKRTEAAMLRLRQVKRMQETSGMSYAEIGKELGVTKQRVQRMLDRLAKNDIPTS